MALQSSSLIAAGLGLAAAGFGGRAVLRHWRSINKAVKTTLDAIPGGAFSKYYAGGFEQPMSKREASLILGVSPTARADRIKQAYKRVMMLNHTDRGIYLYGLQ